VDHCRSPGCGVAFDRTCSGSGTAAVAASTRSNTIAEPPADSEYDADDSGDNHLGYDVDSRTVGIDHEFV